MQTATVKLYSLPYKDFRTYGIAILFIVGNIIVPQLCHTVRMGGPTWLPIYLFTLIGAYKYGWRVGLLTAVASPVLNSLLFGMPVLAALPVILLKSVLLAVIAGFAADHYRKISLGLILGVVLGYQGLGTLGAWAFTGDFWSSAQDFRIGIPGMLLQVFGGWAVIRFILRK